MDALFSCCFRPQIESVEQKNDSRCLSIAFVVAAAVLAVFGALALLKIGHFASLGQTALYIGYGSLFASFMSMIMAVLCVPRKVPVIYVHPENSPQKYRQLNLLLQVWAKDDKNQAYELRKFGISALQFYQRALLLPDISEERKSEIAELYLRELSSFAERASQTQVIRYLKYFDDATIELLKRNVLQGFLYDCIAAAKDDPLRKAVDVSKASGDIGESDIVIPAVENDEGIYHALAESLSIAFRREVKLEEVKEKIPNGNRDLLNELNRIAQEEGFELTLINPSKLEKKIVLGNSQENKIKIFIYGNLWIPIFPLTEVTK